MSLAYRHPSEELGPGLDVQAGHQVHVEEDGDAGDEGDPRHLKGILKFYRKTIADVKDLKCDKLHRLWLEEDGRHEQGENHGIDTDKNDLKSKDGIRG